MLDIPFGFRRRRISLRVIFMFYLIVPLALAMGISGYVALRVWERQVEARMQSDLEMVARAIQMPLSHAMERERQGGIEQALESALSLDTVYGAYAFDREGYQIASAGDRAAAFGREALRERVIEEDGVGEYERDGKRRVYSYSIPLRDSRDQSTGLLLLTRRERDFREYIQRVRLHAGFWFSLSLVVMVGLVVVGHNQAQGRHFKRLVDGMERIAQGDMEHRVPQVGPSEIAVLASRFNAMLDSLQTAEAELTRNRQAQLALEQQLRQSEKMAALGQLAAGVAHELGTPLSTVSGIAQRALRHYEPDSAVGSFFVKIKKEGVRMEVIIRQLLDFSHSRRLSRRSLRPQAIAEAAATAVTSEAAAARATLVLCGDPHAEPCYADPIRLEQALVNLLRNAIQSKAGVDIKLAWESRDGETQFRVDDNGPGVPEALRSRLFEPFFTTKHVGAGTGLGLAVVHGIMQDHGGIVEVEESPLGGARFILRLSAPVPRDQPGRCVFHEEATAKGDSYDA
jgi:two-component system, NtrC family, sensor kinase